MERAMEGKLVAQEDCWTFEPMPTILDGEKIEIDSVNMTWKLVPIHQEEK